MCVYLVTTWAINEKISSPYKRNYACLPSYVFWDSTCTCRKRRDTQYNLLRFQHKPSNRDPQKADKASCWWSAQGWKGERDFPAGNLHSRFCGNTCFMGPQQVWDSLERVLGGWAASLQTTVMERNHSAAQTQLYIRSARACFSRCLQV